jgi:hypothetical protein
MPEHAFTIQCAARRPLRNAARHADMFGAPRPRYGGGAKSAAAPRRCRFAQQQRRTPRQTAYPPFHAALLYPVCYRRFAQYVHDGACPRCAIIAATSTRDARVHAQRITTVYATKIAVKPATSEAAILLMPFWLADSSLLTTVDRRPYYSCRRHAIRRCRRYAMMS